MLIGTIMFFGAWMSFSEEPAKIVFRCNSMELSSEITFPDWKSCHEVLEAGCSCTRVDGPFKLLNKIANAL